VTRWHFAILTGLWATACAPARVVAVDPSVAARTTLAEADGLVRSGCFDCLVDALRQYESVLAIPGIREPATAGAVRASALLALRERELGTTDSGYLERARELAATNTAIREDVAPLLDIVDVIPSRAGVNRMGQPDEGLNLYQSRAERIAMLGSLASRDELSAYVWLSYACASGATGADPDALRTPLGARGDLPLLAFKLSTCPTVDEKAIDQVLEREPRFAELAFYRGLLAGARRKLDEAETRFRQAYAWRSTWPAATYSIANLGMAAEDFGTALEFYDQTLALAGSFPAALLGKLRALTYLARHEDALAVADQLIGIKRYPGDAYYWRAYNELQLERYDQAWADVESADKALINSDVPKLAGIIAINLHSLEVARQKLELSRQRNAADCQTLYYLHLVLAEQSVWPEAVDVAGSASACLDGAEAQTRAEIEGIRVSDAPEARKARRMAFREQQILSDVRMRTTCWFNAAVGNFNLSKTAEARMFAEKVADDAQFGARARDLLARLMKR
jgi:tetratricopeptide (TPR) repeat protein